MSLNAISATSKALRDHPKFRKYLEDYENLARRLLNHVDEGAWSCTQSTVLLLELTTIRSNIM
jgi:hypothetical protein